MCRSSILWIWRKTVDGFAAIGILAFLVNSSFSAEFSRGTPSESSKSLTWKLFERCLIRFINICSGCIFNFVFGSMYFCRRFFAKYGSCLQLFHDITAHSLTLFTGLYSLADNIYALCWIKAIQLLFTLLESVKSEVVCRIGKVNSAMAVYINMVLKIHQEYNFYYIPPFAILIATLNVIRSCLKLTLSLIALSAVNIAEFCFGVIFDLIRKPC